MAKKRREAVQQRNKKQRQRMYFGITTVVIVVLAVAFLLFSQGQSAPVPEGIAEAYAGFEQGVDAQGFPRLGSANAPIVIEEYSSFGCSHCKEFHDQQFQSLRDSIQAGHVQFIYKPITFIANNSANFAGKAARAATCAGQQGHFWEMHDVAFHWQGQYDVNTSRIKGAAEAIGIDVDDLASCYNSNSAEAVIARAESEFRSGEFSGTPTVIMDGETLANPRDVVSRVRDRVSQLGLDG